MLRVRRWCVWARVSGGDLLEEIFVGGFVEIAGLVELRFCFFLAAHGAIELGEAPVHVHFVRLEASGRFEFAERLCISAGIRVDDAEVEVSEP